MSRYVLDTDIVSLFQGGNPSVRDRCARESPANLAVTVITVEEILASWFTFLRRAKSKQQISLAYSRLAESATFLGHLSILPFPVNAIERFEQLKRQKLGVKAPDLRIASIALELGATVVTRNVRDFSRIPTLKVENWAEPS